MAVPTVVTDAHIQRLLPRVFTDLQFSDTIVVRPGRGDDLIATHGPHSYLGPSPLCGVILDGDAGNERFRRRLHDRVSAGFP
ncbi:hypothetical protein [Streptomyces nigra]|uniref:hypothetical protein n=1 Tax=Streptomyces nigra TaxID=1827580 RepID=UPI00343630EF